ncbi:tripartite tricarboxylate transporter permease [Actinophytocola sp.]|uniref:tripartite tricarboxylate transporter permease n=1 Tax=Actinophytocola sp. TaxID=1872138 RepID=UPI003D6B8684
MIGVVWGIIVGALPGVSTLIGITLVIPFTFAMDPGHGIVLIVATAAGAHLGDGLTATLIGVPGTPPAAITAIEGHALTRRGEGGAALYLNLIGAVFGQIFGALMFTLTILPLTFVAKSVLPPEIFAITVFGLLSVAGLAEGDVLKGIGAVLLGAITATIGADPISSVPRFTFGVNDLFGGFQVVPVIVGLLGLGELLHKIDQGTFASGSASTGGESWPRFGRISVPFSELRAYATIGLLGAAIAFVFGIIPGVGATAACFIVYQQSRLVAKRPELFGKGSKEALFAQNTADNSCFGGDLVPTLGLGIPGSASMAVLLGALVVQGVQPGPLLYANRPELVGITAAGLLLAGVALLPIGYLACSLSKRIELVWPPVVAVTSVLLILLGGYTVRGSWFDVYTAMAFGVLGYFLRVYRIPVAATAIGFILGSLLESSFRRGLLTSGGSLQDFLTRPVTLTLLILAVVLLVWQSWLPRRFRRRPRKASNVASSTTMNQGE